MGGMRKTYNFILEHRLLLIIYFVRILGKNLERRRIMEGFEEAHKRAQKDFWFLVITIIILLNIAGVIFSVIYWAL